MKKSKNYFKFFISLLFALLIVNQIQAQEVSLKPYGIESGIIEYNIFRFPGRYRHYFTLMNTDIEVL